MAPGYCNQMFSGKAAAVSCTELKQRFPNLYMEPMQMNNSENKSYDTIPYMLINLGDVDTIYLGRDTLIAYIKGEDASCEYLEVNPFDTYRIPSYLTVRFFLRSCCS